MNACFTDRPQLALVGFMGTGKTTIGNLAAAALGFRFIDLDIMVAAAAGCSIPEIFAREGEAGFRSREHDMLLAISGHPGQVLATGGGIVLRPDHVPHLRRAGLVVALIASPEVIAVRVSEGEGRPLLRNNPEENVRRLLQEREPLYREAADLILDTGALAPAEAADELVRWYQDKSFVAPSKRRGGG